MASEAVKIKASYGADLPGAFKVGIINIVAGSALTAGAAVAGKGYAAGFAAGYLLGFVNLLWLFRIVRKSVGMKADKAMRYVALRYYARFIITAGLIFLMISQNLLEKPWPPVIGISASIFVAIVAMVILAKEELK
ncbi:MAG: ATP synthase subunit I [Thermodesulfobacteriota bacterium]